MAAAQGTVWSWPQGYRHFTAAGSNLRWRNDAAPAAAEAVGQVEKGGRPDATQTASRGPGGGGAGARNRMDDIALARTIHIFAVVIWVGGVSMATSIVIAAVRRGQFGPDRLAAFHAAERRFVWQARAAVLAVGASGFYMTEVLDLWPRFELAEFWWMHAMVGVWLIFMLLLFVFEPLVLHRYFPRWVAVAPDTAFAWLQRAHWLLLTLALVTLAAAAAGSHGLRLA